MLSCKCLKASIDRLSNWFVVRKTLTERWWTEEYPMEFPAIVDLGRSPLFHRKYILSDTELRIEHCGPFVRIPFDLKAMERRHSVRIKSLHNKLRHRKRRSLRTPNLRLAIRRGPAQRTPLVSICFSRKYPFSHRRWQSQMNGFRARCLTKAKDKRSIGPGITTVELTMFEYFSTVRRYRWLMFSIDYRTERADSTSRGHETYRHGHKRSYWRSIICVRKAKKRTMMKRLWSLRITTKQQLRSRTHRSRNRSRRETMLTHKSCRCVNSWWKMPNGKCTSWLLESILDP